MSGDVSETNTIYLVKGDYLLFPQPENIQGVPNTEDLQKIHDHFELMGMMSTPGIDRPWVFRKGQLIDPSEVDTAEPGEGFDYSQGGRGGAGIDEEPMNAVLYGGKTYPISQALKDQIIRDSRETTASFSNLAANVAKYGKLRDERLSKLEERAKNLSETFEDNKDYSGNGLGPYEPRTQADRPVADGA